LLKDKGKTCPNCGYNIGKENEKELVVVRKKCDDANVLLASLYREQNNLSHLISTYQNPENLKKHKRIESFISEYEDKESEMLQKLMNNHQRIETVRSFKAGQSQALKEQKKKIEKDLRKTNIEIERTQKVLEIRTKKLAYYKSLLHHFGKQGFKNYLFGMKLKLIEATVNDFLVRSESEMYLKLDGMKKLKSGKWVQKISSKIYKEARFRTFESLSKGERRRIDLAFIFAFGKLLNFKINFLFRMLDEPFGGLDYKGKKKVIEMMKNLEIPNVVITPENKLGIYYEEENIITIYMKNAISSLER
jgi:DNA repair exonuclease SbcCD ATPase subunit